MLLSPHFDAPATASTSDCADDNFILLDMYKLQDIVKPLTCPRCGDTELHVPSKGIRRTTSSGEQVERKLEEWRRAMADRGLKISRKKIEYVG